MMKTLAERVKLAREALKKQHGVYTQAYVAKELGMEQQSYNAIESGKSQRPRSIEKLAQILQVSPEWLQFGTGNPPEYLDVPSVPPGKIPLIPWGLVYKWHGKYSIAALLESGSFHAGGSAAGDSLQKIQFISIPNRINSKQFAVVVHGDSMVSPVPGNRSFLESVIIVVDPEKVPERDNFVIALQKGSKEAIFKQFVIDGNKQYLRSLNTQYPLIQLDDTIEICGVVVANVDVLV